MTIIKNKNIFILHILPFQNENKFWANDSSDGIVLQDDAKFALAIVVIILAFLDWMVAFLGILLGIMCPPQSEVSIEGRGVVGF